MSSLWKWFSGNDDEKTNKSIPTAPSQKILKRIRDPITGKIMVNPTMILSSLMVYEAVTINKWIQTGRAFDPLTGVPVQVGSWPMLLEYRSDIKEKIDTFLERYPKYKSEVFDVKDTTIQWAPLFAQCEANIKQKYINTVKNQSALQSRAKQIFQTKKLKVDQKANEETGILYNKDIILQPEIPIICFMGPSRNGKSTIVNDILGVRDACAVSSKSNVALTKGAWLTLYSATIPNEEEKQQPGALQSDDMFYLMDMEGLTHDVTIFTKRLFYSCYATANVIVWNDKNVAGDEFKKLMNELKEEMKAVASSNQKPSFIYLKRDAGDYDYDPYDTFDEYINKDETFAWFREMNIFSSLSAYELDRPQRDKKDKKGGLNFHNPPQNQQLLPPLIVKIVELSKNSKRFASNQFILKQQIAHINGATMLSMTKKLIAQNEILSLFLIASKKDYWTRRRDMIYVACKFEWDHAKLEKLFNEHMNELKESQKKSHGLDQSIFEKLIATKNEIYERVKNKIEHKNYGQTAGVTIGAGVTTLVGVGGLILGASSGAILLAAAGWGALGFLSGYGAGKAVEVAEKVVVDTFTKDGYIKYSLGRTEEEIEQDKKKVKSKSQFNLDYNEEELEAFFSAMP